MSTIKREWLLHGCLKLDSDEADNITMKIKAYLSEAYEGEEFKVRLWPKFNYKNTLWWYEKSYEIPCEASSFFLKTDNSRGPMLYVGISVEKGYEDKNLARKIAKQSGERIERWSLRENWNWNRFISIPTWENSKPLIIAASRTLNHELYLWLEFEANGVLKDSKYYVIQDGNLYERIGYKIISWSKVREFIIRSRPKLWGNIYLARAFSLDECTPVLDEGKLIEVIEAMRPIRDLWRGV